MSKEHWGLMLLVKALPALALAGCVTSAEIRTFEDRQPRAPVGDPRPIMFSKLVSRIPQGTPIGAIQLGLFCEPRTQLIWQRPEGTQVGAEDLAAPLTSELTKAGYKVVGTTEALFEAPPEWEAEFLLAGNVKHIASNACHLFANSSGETSVEIEWQLFERRARSVVLTLTTGGTSRVSMSPGGAQKAYLGAYTAALRNLLADERFAAVTSGKAQPPASATSQSPLVADLVTVAEEAPASSELIDYVRRAVVTIPVGTGHGSGVIVSRSGLLLTTAHIVGVGDTPVQVELEDGHRAKGEVLRVNRRTDVALVQLETGNYRPAPVGPSNALRIGDTVFAIGTPLAQRFGQTVTKGVVSAIRTEAGQRLIQSDVTVHAGHSGGPLLDAHGRVVALTQSGVALGGVVGVGLNTFVPIESAWTALGVTPRVSRVPLAELLARPIDGGAPR